MRTLICLMVLSVLPLTADDAKTKPRPVLEVKIFSLQEVDPASATNILSALLGETDAVIEKAQQPKNAEPNLGNWLPDITAPLWRAATDDRTRTLIVRGTAGHIALASDIVAVIDRKEDQPLPGTKTLHAFTLKRTTTGEVTNILGALEFEGLRMANHGETLLLVVGPEETLKTVAAIVAALDAPAKK